MALWTLQTGLLNAFYWGPFLPITFGELPALLEGLRFIIKSWVLWNEPFFGAIKIGRRIEHWKTYYELRFKRGYCC